MKGLSLAVIVRMSVLCLALAASFSTAHAEHVEMSGSLGYGINGPDVTMEVERIDNLSETTSTGTLGLELWATIYGYDGRTTYRYLLAYTELIALPPNSYMGPISRTVFIRPNAPPPGIYNIVMVLVEANGGSGIIHDYVNFASTRQFGEVVPVPPTITSPLSVVTVAGRPFNYQIKVNNGALEYRATSVPAGLTLNRFTGLISGTNNTPGNYTIKISAGNNGGIDVKNLSLLVATLPVFNTVPVAQSVYLGSNVTFTAGATGFPTPRYQWQFKGTNIAGATGSSYTVRNAQLANAGNYRVLAINAGGATASANALLSVCNYTFTPVFASIPHSGVASNVVSVAVSGGCSWSVQNTNDWIEINLGGTGNGNGAFVYSVEPNTNSLARIGFLNIGNKSFAVTQGGAPALETINGKTIAFCVNGQPSGAIFTARSEDTYTKDNLSAGYGTFAYTLTGPDTATFAFTDFFPDFEPVNGTSSWTFTNRGFGSFSTTTDSGTQNGTFKVTDTKSDYNGDNLPDLLLQNSKGTLAAWAMNGTNFLRSMLVRNGLAAGSGWQVVGTSDISSDAHPDILLQHTGGKLAAWRMAGTNFLGAVVLRGGTPVPIGSRVVGLADFNRDGHNDILLQLTNRSLSVWYMFGTNFISSAPLRKGIGSNPGWSALGISDFNADGESDVVWQHSDGKLAVWTLVRGEFVASTLLRNGQGIPVGWRLAAVGDLDNDGSDDLLFQHSTGKMVAWFMNGSTFLRAQLIRNGQSPGSGRRLVGPK